MQPTDTLASPVGFARAALGLSLYDWQEFVLWDADEPGAVVLRAANGSGKTTAIAGPLALWHAAAFPSSLCIVTAGVFRQVKEQLFPAIRQHAHRFGGWNFNETDVTAPNGSRVIGFSTDEPGRFEGWHNENLLVIVDEAKTVPDSIFEAIERCQPKRLLVMSSPGGCSGFFYEAFNLRRKFFRQHAVTAHQCPHIPPAWIAEQLEKYGPDSPLVRSMIFAEFMANGEDSAVIPLTLLERCISNPPAFDDDGTAQAFCDFAAGGDENVLAVRRGNRVEIAAAWREKDTMRAVGQFIRHFRERELQASEIFGDEGGLGKAMCDALREAGWPIRRVNNGSPADKPDAYANKGAAIWYEGRTRIERQSIILPHDKQLLAQLTARRGWPDSKGRLQLESKEEMRGRGLSSPDRADAALGAIFHHHVFTTVVKKLRGW